MSDKKDTVLLYVMCGITLFTVGLLSVLFFGTSASHFPNNISDIHIPKAFLIMSGSMEPKIKVGSVVVSMSSGSYAKGDIITFSPDGNEKNIVTHRIKNIKGQENEPVYITGGDANKVNDSREIKDGNIFGKVIFTIPYLGYFADYAKTTKGFIFFIVVPTTIIIYEELRFLGLSLNKGLRKIRLKIKKNKEKSDDIMSSERKKLPKVTIIIPISGAFLLFVAISSSYFSDRAKSSQNVMGAASSFPQTYLMENKRIPGDWGALLNDGIEGVLKYYPEGPTFKYEFIGKGLVANKQYCLIYYADPYPGNNPGALIDKGNSNNMGDLLLSGNKDLGISLPQLPDGNYANGAKVWLVPCANYAEAVRTVSPWAPNNYDWLFETGWVKYLRTTLATSTPSPSTTPLPSSTVVSLSNLGASPQYGYVYDYSQASVAFSYVTPSTGNLNGTITATGLKPYATYQLKLEGTPLCKDLSGDDSVNEKIGYKGRWWDNTSNSNLNSSPVNNDAFYLANSIYHGGTHCITGYLVWDFITADSFGNVTKNVATNNSYHVLWCGGGTCNTSNNTNLQNLSGSTDPGFPYCASSDVNGQLERGSCGGLSLDTGSYKLKLILTEESFHQSAFGNWTAVMDCIIDFQIN